MEHERIEVGAVRPDDRSRIVVHAHLREERRVVQRLEDPLERGRA
jgi:hypothetical protein